MEEKLAQSFKRKVYEQYKQVLNDKVSFLQKMLQDVIASTNNETKSSAGDKHETGRAMLQIEQDNVRKQLKEVLAQQAAFTNIEQVFYGARIIKGSLVETDKAWLFVSVGLGKITIEGITVVALSPQAPLGSKLIGVKTGGKVTMNGITYTILNII